MTSIIQIVENANSKLYAARNKVNEEFEAHIECLWILFKSCCNVSDDKLIREISSAIQNRKNSGGKTYVAGYVQTFIRKHDGDYTPHPLVAPLYNALKICYDIDSKAWKTAQDEWEKIVTFKVLCDYHVAKNKNRVFLHDDDAY